MGNHEETAGGSFQFCMTAHAARCIQASQGTAPVEFGGQMASACASGFENLCMELVAWDSMVVRSRHYQRQQPSAQTSFFQTSSALASSCCPFDSPPASHLGLHRHSRRHIPHSPCQKPLSSDLQPRQLQPCLAPVCPAQKLQQLSCSNRRQELLLDMESPFPSVRDVTGFDTVFEVSCREALLCGNLTLT
jgi:hypothetical protein